MADITAYTDFYPMMMPELPGCPEDFLLQSIKKTVRKFCQDTDAWREQLASIDLKDGVLGYELVSKWDAEIRHIVEVRIKTADDNLASADVVTTAAIGATSIDIHGLNIATGTIYAGTQFTIVGGGGTLYTVQADATVAAHATTLSISPALTAQATAGDELSPVPPLALGELIKPSLYTYYGDASVRLDVAVAAKTLYLDDSLEPAEDVDNGLDVKVSLVPELNTDATEMDMDFLVRWSEAIIGGTIFWLMTMKGRKWTDTQRAPLFLLDYNRGVSRARRENVGGQKVDMEDLSA